MGCDIHCILEMKGRDGIWKVIKGYPSWITESIANYTKELNDPTIAEQAQGYIKWLESMKEIEDCWIFDDRNYDLFALLADVRNYEDWEAMFPYRGLPELSAISTRLEQRDWGEDAHSWTYFSLKEIKEANWDKEVSKTAVVEDSIWDEFVSNPDMKQPRSWCAMTNCANYQERTWNITYRDIAKRFFDRVVSKMEILARHSPSGDEGVRLVIFFDN